MPKNKLKSRKQPKKPSTATVVPPEKQKVINVDEILKKFGDIPDPGPGFLVVPFTTTTYKCCTEEDGAPTAGCGFEFLEPRPTSDVVCPKCGNYWVKWIHYHDDYNNPFEEEEKEQV